MVTMDSPHRPHLAASAASMAARSGVRPLAVSKRSTTWSWKVTDWQKSMGKSMEIHGFPMDKSWINHEHRQWKLNGQITETSRDNHGKIHIKIHEHAKVLKRTSKLDGVQLQHLYWFCKVLFCCSFSGNHGVFTTTSKSFHRFHGKFTIILFRGEASNTTIAKTHSLLRPFWDCWITALPALPQSSSQHSIDVAMWRC